MPKEPHQIKLADAPLQNVRQSRRGMRRLEGLLESQN
jgi:hypothetical protein